MLSEDLRRRIAALNRGTLKHVPRTDREDSSQEDTSSDDLRDEHVAIPNVLRRTSSIPPPGGYQQTTSLDQLVQGQVIEEEGGCFLLIERTLRDLWKEADTFHDRYRSVVLDRKAKDPGGLSEDMQKLLERDRHTMLYMDIETTGFSGSPLFLVGIMHYAEEVLVIRQLFARDYSEEAYLLKHLMKLMEDFQILVSYNGKAFDLPYIRDRSVIHRVRFQHDPLHLDLLHEARRRWRDCLPNCRLQTLERVICHRVRIGDIPGSEIPQVYHDFVRAGNAIHIRQILHHNAQDLITMGEVLAFMLEGREPGD